MNKKATAFILVFILICLPGCEKKASGNAVGPVIRQDEEGLVEVRIENGEATLTFNLDKWEKQYNLSLYIEEFVYNPSGAIPKSGPFKISGFSGKVLDACVGKVLAMDYYYFPFEYFDDFIIPSIMLLMDDGTVNWLLANPMAQLFERMLNDSSYHIDGKLPLINNIASLSFEDDNAGFGEKAFFAADREGSRYNLLAPWKLLTLCDAAWYCMPIGSIPAYTPALLSFDESGGVTLKRRHENGFIVLHKGTYKINLIKNSEQFPAAFSFDLSLDWWDTPEGDTKSPPQKISGKYSVETDGELWTLWQGDGDPLFMGDNLTPEGYSLARFNQPDEDVDMTGESRWFFQEEVLSILETLCEETMNSIARGMVVVNGEEKVDINGDDCHIVHLGNYVNSRHFVTRAIYAVNYRYEVFRYDAKTQKWIALAMG